MSAVDAHVGRAIFENCIAGLLKGKTRILVTHQLQYMPQVDFIIMLKDGEIAEMGTFNELLAANSAFSTLFRTHVHEAEKESNGESEGEGENKKKSDSKSKEEGGRGELTGSKGKEKAGEGGDGEGKKGADGKKEPKKETKIISVEERDVGSVSWRVYKDYTMAIGGVLLVGTIIAFYMLDQTAQVASSWWLSIWSGADATSDTTLWYVGIYAALGLGATLCVLVRAFLFAYGTLQSAKTLHERLIARVSDFPPPPI